MKVTHQEQATAIMRLLDQRITPTHVATEILLQQANVHALLALTEAIQEAIGATDDR